MSKRALVSIGMPVRNSEATIGLAIASIIGQTYDDWELLVADDGSDDGTIRIVESFRDPRIRLMTDGERKGIPIRRNQILAEARGAYMAWMDSDDISYPNRIAVEAGFLDSHPEVDLVASEMIVFRDQGQVIGKRTLPADHKTIARRPYWGFPMSQPTFMGRLSWFRKFRYDERMRRAQDQEILLRAFRTSTYAGIQQILVGYRETRISLKKIFLGRRLWVASILRDAKANASMVAGVAAALVQLGKISIESLAVLTRLDYILLPHRAMPVTPLERKEFEMVYASAAHRGATPSVEQQSQVAIRR